MLLRNGYVSHPKKGWEAVQQTLHLREQKIWQQDKLVVELKQRIDLAYRAEEGLKQDLRIKTEAADEWEQEFHRIRGEKGEQEKQLREQLEKLERVADNLSRRFLQTSLFSTPVAEDSGGPEVVVKSQGYKPSSQRRAEMKRMIFESELLKARERADGTTNTDSTEPEPDAVEESSADLSA